MFGKRAKLGNRIDEDCVCLLTKEEVEGEGVFVFSFFFSNLNHQRENQRSDFKFE